MSKIGKYAVIMPRVKHIQHTFDSYEEAIGWMNNASSTGYIAVIVAEVVNKVESVKESRDLIEYARKKMKGETA